MEEKFYIFTRKVIVKEFGGVTATSEEEAIEKIMEGEYDDIIDSWTLEHIAGSIEIEEQK